MKEINIRTANLSDAKQLLEIYAPYVEKTAVTFEYEVPSLNEFRERINFTLQKYPWILAEQEGKITGYAYSGSFVGRAAYDWSAEVSVYVREDWRGKGTGRKLYAAIEEISRAQNILNLNACIASPVVEDEYLTRNSIQFYAHMGYTVVGEFHKCGYKFNTWYDMVWMEKILGGHKVPPERVIRFPDLQVFRVP